MIKVREVILRFLAKREIKRKRLSNKILLIVAHNKRSNLKEIARDVCASRLRTYIHLLRLEEENGILGSEFVHGQRIYFIHQKDNQ